MLVCLLFFYVSSFSSWLLFLLVYVSLCLLYIYTIPRLLLAVRFFKAFPRSSDGGRLVARGEDPQVPQRGQGDVGPSEGDLAHPAEAKVRTRPVFWCLAVYRTMYMIAHTPTGLERISKLIFPTTGGVGRKQRRAMCLWSSVGYRIVSKVSIHRSSKFDISKYRSFDVSKLRKF